MQFIEIQWLSIIPPPTTHESRLLQKFSVWSIILQNLAYEFLLYRLYIMNLTRNIN